MNSIIVTTDHSDFSIVDIDTGSITHINGKTPELDRKNLEGKGRHTYRPFGVEIDEDSIFVVSNDVIGMFDKKTFKFQGLVDLILHINTHQIVKDGDTWITCNTAVDCIGFYGKDNNKQFNVNLLNKIDKTYFYKDSDTYDSRHVNSLLNEGEKLYFCRHNGGIVDSDFWELDKRTLRARKLINAGRCCHGIRFLNNQLITLSTGTGELLKIDLATNNIQKYKICDPDKVFLRGLEIFGNKIIIGCSVNFKKLTDEKLECFVLVYDMQSNTELKITLPNQTGINDLRSFK